MRRRRPRRRTVGAQIRAAERQVAHLVRMVRWAARECGRSVAWLLRHHQDGRAMHAGVNLLAKLARGRTKLQLVVAVHCACADGGWLHVLSEHLDPGGVRLTPASREALARRIERWERSLR
ncbi:MAG TPA: hypothetical protein VJ735_09325 [Actinomycetes bacterium]|nr:hypothetical protein [Actinomycetes bacterium]